MVAFLAIVYFLIQCFIHLEWLSFVSLSLFYIYYFRSDSETIRINERVDIKVLFHYTLHIFSHALVAVQ